jgi:hypothetical protein
MTNLSEMIESILVTAFIWGFPGIYALLLIWAALRAGGGSVGWLVMGLGISPFMVVWYKIVKDRSKQEAEAIRKPQSKFLTEEEMKEAIEILLVAKRKREEETEKIDNKNYDDK